MDYYGRRPAIMIAIFPLLIGWSILGTATSHFAILAGRIVAGIATGLIGAPAQVSFHFSVSDQQINLEKFYYNLKIEMKLVFLGQIKILCPRNHGRPCSELINCFVK